MGNAGIIHSILYTILLMFLNHLYNEDSIRYIIPFTSKHLTKIPPALHFCKKTPLSAYDMYPFIQMRRT